MIQATRVACVMLAASAALVGCSSNDAPGSGTVGSAGTSSNGGTGSTLPNAGASTGGTLMLDPPAMMETGGSAGTGTGSVPLTGLTMTESGGYKRGDRIDTAGGAGGPNIDVTSPDGCGALVGVVRDFKSKDPGRHPDFETFGGQTVVKNLVAPDIGTDRKPVYASKCELGMTLDATACPTGPQTTTKANFDQWYRDTPDVNQAYLIYFKFAPTGMGNVVSFRSENFVPLDGAGWMDTFDGEGGPHNYAFTTELHIKFQYSGGESFTFKGDDDVWAFINGKLAMDLGGLHESREDTIVLDAKATELGLVKGEVYPLDLFHAERHSTGSHFRMDSTLTVVDCGSVPVVPK
jgi:fibro-slime domain-containing protein